MLQPIGKARLETDLHATDRHIEEMFRTARAVGHAAAQALLGLGDDDSPIRTFSMQLEAERGAAETAAYNDHCFGGHGVAGPAVFSRCCHFQSVAYDDVARLANVGSKILEVCAAS